VKGTLATGLWRPHRPPASHGDSRALAIVVHATFPARDPLGAMATITRAMARFVSCSLPCAERCGARPFIPSERLRHAMDDHGDHHVEPGMGAIEGPRRLRSCEPSRLHEVDKFHFVPTIDEWRRSRNLPQRVFPVGRRQFSDSSRSSSPESLAATS
jgi:hypothetical protein